MPGFPLSCNPGAPTSLPYVLTPGSTLSCGARLPPTSSNVGCRGTFWLTESPDVDIASLPPAFPAPSPCIAPCVDMVPRHTHALPHNHSRHRCPLTLPAQSLLNWHTPHTRHVALTALTASTPVTGPRHSEVLQRGTVLPFRHCHTRNPVTPLDTGTNRIRFSGDGTQSQQSTWRPATSDGRYRDDSPARVHSTTRPMFWNLLLAGAPPAPPQLLGWGWPVGGASLSPAPASRRFPAVDLGSETTCGVVFCARPVRWIVDPSGGCPA